jgi:hypothetical protein
MTVMVDIAEQQCVILSQTGVNPTPLCMDKKSHL